MDRAAKRRGLKQFLEEGNSITPPDPMSDRQRQQLEDTWKEMSSIYPEDYDAYSEPKKYTPPKGKKLVSKYQLIPSAQSFDAVRLSKWADSFHDSLSDEEKEVGNEGNLSLTLSPPPLQKKDHSWAPVENLRGKENLGVTWKKGLEVFSITTYSEEAEDLVLQTFYDQLEQHGWLLVRARVS